jgi:flagellar hook assembly protein FlgD
LAAIALEQNHPNPFNPSTEIGFSIGEADDVHLAIYDVRGALVSNLVNRRMAPGHYRETWNGRDDLGREVPSGIYFYRVTVGEYALTRRAVLLR